MKPEAENFEHKSKFYGSDSEWLTLIKTIVAMANTKGGTIKINNIQNVDFSGFDTAKIDDKINAYINPRIHNIVSRKDSTNSIEILVPNSNAKPHIFKKDGAYKNPNPPPQQKFEFYEGQIWVRHSGKNERATSDDFNRMFKEKLAEFLNSIHIIAAQFPLGSKEIKIVEKTSKSAIPLKIMKKGEGLPVIEKRVDPNIDYPYTAKTIGNLLGKNQNFIAATTHSLGMKNDIKYAIKIKNPEGKIVMIKYSQEALDFLRQFFIENPDYTPYRKDKVKEKEI